MQTSRTGADPASEKNPASRSGEKGVDAGKLDDIISEIEKTIKKYLKREKEIEDEKNERLRKAVWEGNKDEENRIYDEYDERINELWDELYDECDFIMKNNGVRNYELVLEVIDRFSDGREVWQIANIRVNTTLVNILAMISSGQVIDIWTEERVYISDETTPFTNTVVHNVPWHLIRDEWAEGIWDSIYSLAEDEINNKLEEGVMRIIDKCKANMWIWDYLHLYDAVKQTIMTKFPQFEKYLR